MTPRRPGKDERERLVLLGLVELFLESGKPIGSSTLREAGFQNLSSATIRNYFAKLEEQGFLKQQHSSGGRIPTDAAYRLYVEINRGRGQLKEKEAEELRLELTSQTREVGAYLERAAEILAERTECAIFLSTPRFDQDFILDIKLVEIDSTRCLCVLITDFGLVHSEILYLPPSSHKVDLSKISLYLQAKITGLAKPTLSSEEEKLGARLYKEIMLRHIVSYSNFSAEDIVKTGFSKLLSYPDFNNASALASGLSLFENQEDLRTLIKTACDEGDLVCLIGEDLSVLRTPISGCSLILIPYRIHKTVAGAIALLGPNRLPYKKLFSLLEVASEAITKTLTNSLYKFKITFRKPQNAQIELESKSTPYIDQARGLLTVKKEEE